MWARGDGGWLVCADIGRGDAFWMTRIHVPWSSGKKQSSSQVEEEKKEGKEKKQI